MTNPQRSYRDAPEWQNGDPHAPLPLEILKGRALEALEKSDTDALDKVLADALALCNQADEDQPSYEAVRQAFAAIKLEDPDTLRPAVEQLTALLQWKRRPTARAVDEINDPQPTILLTAAGQDGPLLTAGMVATLSGAGGTGKSKLVLQIALQIAAANECGPTPDKLWEATAGPVLVCTYEDAARMTADYLRQQAERLNCHRGLAHVKVLDLAGYPLFGPGEAQSYNTRPSRLFGFHVLAGAAEKIGPRLIVIDPALFAYVGEANATSPVREFVAALAQLASQHNAAVLLVAHSTKGARLSNSNSKPDLFDAGQMSGSAAWHDAARACLVLTRETDDMTSWTLAVAKANYGPSFIKTSLKYKHPVFRAADSPAWKDKDGQPTTQEDNPYA